MELFKLEILETFQIGKSWNFPSWRFFNFSKQNVFEIFQTGIFRNFPNSRINKFPEFYNFFRISESIFRILQFRKLTKLKKISNLESQNLAPQIRTFWNCSFIRYSALHAILPFDLWYKSIFSIFIPYLSDSQFQPF